MSDLNSQYIIAQEEHDYNKKYEEGTIVKHTIDDVTIAYIAKKNVPQFISILNENYWKKIASTASPGGGGVDIFDEDVEATDAQRNKALANVSNQTANSSTGKMGYKVLDPTKTFAEQVTTENTIYEIRDVFNLNAAEMTIPSNCTLKFNGGKLVNGSISGNNCDVEGDELIFDNVIVSGVPLLKWSWFAVGEGDTVDNSSAFTKLVSSINSNDSTTVLLDSGIYSIQNCSPTITKNCIMKGDNTTLILGSEPLKFHGSATPLTVVEGSIDSSTFISGSENLTVSFEEELNVGDIITILDKRNYSGSLARHYLYNGDLVGIKSIDNNSIQIDTPIVTTYDSNANFEFSKYNPIKVNISGLKLYHNTEKHSVSVLFVIIAKDSIIENVVGYNNSESIINVLNCINLTIRNVNLNHKSESQQKGLGYGIVIGGGKNIIVDHSYLKTNRHGIAMGSTGTVPLRGVKVMNSTISCYGDNFSADCHGHTYDIDFINCTITGGITNYGENVKYINCVISNEDNVTKPLIYSIYNNAEFNGCKFTSFKNPTTGYCSQIGNFRLPLVPSNNKTSFFNCIFDRQYTGNGADRNNVFLQISDNMQGYAWTYEENTLYTIDDNNTSGYQPRDRMPLYSTTNFVGYAESVSSDFSTITYNGNIYQRDSNSDTILVPYENNNGNNVDFVKCNFLCDSVSLYLNEITVGNRGNVLFDSCYLNSASICVVNNSKMTIRNCDFIYNVYSNQPPISLYNTIKCDLYVENNVFENALGEVISDRQSINGVIGNIVFVNNTIKNLRKAPNYDTAFLFSSTNILSDKIVIKDNIFINNNKNIQINTVSPIEVVEENNKLDAYNIVLSGCRLADGIIRFDNNLNKYVVSKTNSSTIFSNNIGRNNINTYISNSLIEGNIYSFDISQIHDIDNYNATIEFTKTNTSNEDSIVVNICKQYKLTNIGYMLSSNKIIAPDPSVYPYIHFVFKENDTDYVKFAFCYLYDTKLIDLDGYTAALSKGDTASRPTNLTADDNGFQYFDEDLGKFICWIWNTTASSGDWYNLDGTALS